jgi:Asp-tRNA(Asn)/Glu-tRNA(Gln) amidotransferase A subunit family amidase
VVVKPERAMKNDGTYDLTSVNSPRMAGKSLIYLAGLLEKSVPRFFLSGTLIKSAGVDKLRGMQFDEPPTYYPIHPVSLRCGDEMEHNIEAGIFTGSGYKPASIREYGEGYRSGQFTPMTVAQDILAAIERSDEGEKPLRSFIAVNVDDLIKQAEESTRRYQEGRPASILDGVPVAIKDEFDMFTYGTTVGTRFLGKTSCQQDATVVARLRACGALLPGKTNMHEIGIGISGLNIYHGTARNPYNLDHHTGGSSSGSAAAVAAGIVPVALGADAGGSIRIPASHCGLVGLKPTFGRVSEYGAAPLCWSMAHIGPIASTAADAALIYTVIAGADPKDPNSLHQPCLIPVVYEQRDLKPLKLGVYWPWFEHAQPDIVARCKQLLAEFQQRGAEIVEIEVPDLNAARIAHLITIMTEMYSNMCRYSTNELSPETRAILAIARTLSSRDYTTAQQVRSRIITSFNQALAQVDMVITPTAAITAPPIHPDALATGEYDVYTVTESMRFVFASNLTGLPAITFPAGYDTNGLPVGMQAIGRPWEEHRLLSLALTAESIIPRQRPQSLYLTLPDGEKKPLLDTIFASNL